MLLLSTKKKKKIILTDERTYGRVVCKIVFSITFKVSFWCSKEPSHREDSFAHQKCVSENIIVDYALYQTNIKTKHKKAGKGRPASEIPFEWRFASGTILIRHCVLARFIC